MQLSRSSSRRPTSSVAIVSLFLTLTTVYCWAQGLEGERARAEDFPLAVTLPPDWEALPASPEEPGELLFLQHKSGPDKGGFMTLSAFPSTGSFPDLVKKQTYHVVVDLGVPMTINQEFKLRGARGHKWVYRAKAEDGQVRQFYRVYLMLPAMVSGRRLLVIHGDAPVEQGPEALFLFNAVTRSVGWGLQAQQ